MNIEFYQMLFLHPLKWSNNFCLFCCWYGVSHWFTDYLFWMLSLATQHISDFKHTQCKCLSELLNLLYKCVYFYVLMGFPGNWATINNLLIYFMLYSKQSHMINSPMLLRTELIITWIIIFYALKGTKYIIIFHKWRKDISLL